MVLTRASRASASASASDGGSTPDGDAGPVPPPSTAPGSLPLPDLSAFAYTSYTSLDGSAAALQGATAVVTPSTSDEGAVSSPSSSRGPPARPATRRGAVRPKAITPKVVKIDVTTAQSGEKGGSPASSTSSAGNSAASPDAVVSTPTKKRRGSTKSPKQKGKIPGSRSGSPRKKRQRIEPGSVDPPEGWEDVYELVRELRADRSAPVDTEGGHALPERQLGPEVRRFQVLIALMLSSQTKDAVVGETMRALQGHGLTVNNIRDTPHEDLNKLIRKVGFHNNKTKYIKKVVDILAMEYDGDIPPTADKMMELPGIGPKMAYIIESEAFGTTTGIGVDTHMHRIFNALGWVKSTNPEGTREQLEGWLPRERWSEVNVLWVGVGQETQQQKEKALRKALACSRPADALMLMRRLGLKVEKEAKKFGLENEVEHALSSHRK